MQIRYDNNINYRGYKNVVSYSCDEPRYELRYIGMQLDDVGENKDLETLKTIRSIIKPNSLEDDIVTITFARYEDYPMRLYFDNYKIPSDEELKSARKTFKHGNYAEYEKLSLKIYSLLASLTKRISEEVSCAQDEECKATIQSRYIDDTLPAITNNKNTKAFFIKEGEKQNTTLQKIANIVNNEISSRMFRYFL